MAGLPLNFVFAALFMLGVVWGWEGEEERQFFAVMCSIFMLPLWITPMYLLTDITGTWTIVTVNGWLPTLFFQPILYFTGALMYFTAAHLMQTLNREEPLGRALKRARKHG